MPQTAPNSSLVAPDIQSDLIEDLGADTFETMVQSLARCLTKRLAEIEQAVLSGDHGGLLHAAHDIRGSALNLGFTAIGHAARALEQSTGSGQIDDQACQHLRHAIEQSRAEIPSLRSP